MQEGGVAQQGGYSKGQGCRARHGPADPDSAGRRAEEAAHAAAGAAPRLPASVYCLQPACAAAGGAPPGAASARAADGRALSAERVDGRAQLRVNDSAAATALRWDAGQGAWAAHATAGGGQAVLAARAQWLPGGAQVPGCGPLCAGSEPGCQAAPFQLFFPIPYTLYHIPYTIYLNPIKETL